MKKLELIFTVILLPLDYLALLLAGSLAYLLRFESFVAELRPVIFSMNFEDFFRVVIMAAGAWILIFALSGLYSTKRHSLIKDYTRIFIASSAATLIIVVAFFFNFQLFSSRLIILTSWLLSVIFICFERTIVHFVKKIFYFKGIGVRRIAVIGKNHYAQDIIYEFKANPSFGFRVVKNYDDFNLMAEEELSLLVNQSMLDDIILANNALPDGQKNRLVNFCTSHQLNYKFVASLLETKLINFDIGTIGGQPVIEVRQTSLDGWGRILKRLFDLIIGIVILFVLLPLLLLIGVLVVATSNGQIMVKLPRVGTGGKKFNLYKFRSMIKDAHKLKPVLRSANERADGPLFKMTNDPRITRFGGFLRRWSIDELPQLLNVIGGQMSLVGPRPHEPEEVSRYETGDKKLLVIKPGITGLAQVSGRSDLLWEEEVRLDTYYIENWSLGLDIQILLKTPLAVLGKRQAS